MARRIALRIARRTPSRGSPDDLVSAAMVGLAEAVDRFDPSRGEPFVAFAEKRIRGAVLDELRRGDILPRRVRATARKVASVAAKLEQELGRPAEDEEMAARLEVSVETYREELSGLTQVSLVDLPAPDREDLGDLGSAEGQSPLEHAEKRELVAMVRNALEVLDRRDATLLSLYYVEDLTYAEIGQVLEVSESRVCQLHGRAMLRLRAALGLPDAPLKNKNRRAV
jgi:RNA polymerase sigma factor for flagellar operon FliA